ncbi:MAG: ATP-binding cassette domain-containing protein [Planctomycetota bacterium]
MIEVKGLVKRFGPILAVDRVSFSAAKGDVLGFLGPNGAGKTTTIRILACFLAPDAGAAKVAGHDIVADPVAVRREIGYVAENAPAYDEMTAESFLSFTCEARGMPRRQRRSAVNASAEMCAITSVMHQPIGTLSKGFRRRVGLAQALAHDPPVLLLDEPTDGLDPNQKHDVRQLIKRLAEKKCIVVSTHILEEVDAICNRIVIIDRGRILVDTTAPELTKREGTNLEAAFRRLTTRHAAKADTGGAS